MKVRNHRIKSEVIQLDYISPWRSHQQSGRNDLQLFLTKNSILQEGKSQKYQLSKTVILDSRPEREVVLSPKKTTRTLHKTATDFNKSRQSYNHNHYSRSLSLLRHRQRKSEQITRFQNNIFMKKYPPSKQISLVTVGKIANTEQLKTKDETIQSPFFTTQDYSQNQNALLSKKKQYKLKKQTLAQSMLKSEIHNQKIFVKSLQNCLAQMQKTEKINNSKGSLSKTLKTFISHYKKY